MIAARELELVELVSPDGARVGTATVIDAHTEPGLLHRAFSVLLFDAAGRTLLQQRSAAKTRFPLRWANSCCGHPAPGEAVAAAAARRVVAELGLDPVDLVEVGVYTYRALDATTGRVEHEYDHVLVGRIPADVRMSPDPAEVAAIRWVEASRLVTDVDSPDYAPWLSGVLPVAVSHATP